MEKRLNYNFLNLSLIEYAEAIEEMPLTNKFPKAKVKIPANLDIGSEIHTDVYLSPFNKKITYKAGACSKSPNLHATFNFDNGDFHGVSIDGISYTFNEDKYNDFKTLGKKLARYFHNRGFNSVTISTGDISYDPNTHTIDITELQIQDSKQISSDKYVYTSLSLSESIDLDDLLLALALAAVGVAVIAFAPEAVGAAAYALAAAAEYLAPAFA